MKHKFPLGVNSLEKPFHCQAFISSQTCNYTSQSNYSKIYIKIIIIYFIYYKIVFSRYKIDKDKLVHKKVSNLENIIKAENFTEQWHLREFPTSIENPICYKKYIEITKTYI